MAHATTLLAPLVVIRAANSYRGWAIPLAWRALRRTSAMVSFAAYQPSSTSSVPSCPLVGSSPW